MDFFDTFPFTKLQGKNRGLDWVIQKVTDFQKTIDNIPNVVNAVIGDAISKGEIDVTVNVETDSTLTRPGVGADAAAVGERFNDLTAEDVGARAADWMPTAEDVGARAADWLPTADEVGARAADWMPTAAEVGARAADWLPNPYEIGGVWGYTYTINPASTIRLQIPGIHFFIGRLGGGCTSNAVYCVTGYSTMRAPLVTTISDGQNLVLTVGGSNDTGWYVDFANTSGSTPYILLTFGSENPRTV